LSELGQLDLGDVNLSARIVRVMGKGRKERLVPFNTSTKDALAAWLKDRAALREAAIAAHSAAAGGGGGGAPPAAGGARPVRGGAQRPAANRCSSTSAARG